MDGSKRKEDGDVALRVALRPPSDKEWENAKEKIRELYIEQELPLKAVRAQMKERGFVAR
jgi:Clr5 domain